MNQHAPSGMSVFEITALTLLAQRFSPGLVISATLYRLGSILAEAAGAGLAWLDERMT